MPQAKKDRSTESARELLKALERDIKAYEKKVGRIPTMHADFHNTQLRNHFRSKK
jgi:hypothetical protein